MPNIKSNLKSLKKDRERRLVRISYKKKLKKVVNKAIEDSNISELYKNLDSQLSKGIIKKNKCNRLKSRYAKMIKK